MNDDTLLNTATINDINEQLRKEEELMQTIKMEPILEKTELDEEPSVTKEKKRIKLTDIFLIGLIIILLAVFIFVVLKVK